MKQFLKLLFAVGVLTSSAIISIKADCGTTCNTSCNTDCNSRCDNVCGPRSIFIPRSTGADTYRELVGWQTLIHRFDVCEFYLTSAFAFEYQRSFKSDKIAQALFGTDTLKFRGSQVDNRTTSAPALTFGCCNSCDNDCSSTCDTSCNILADYFGFSPRASFDLAVCPRIENFTFDFEFYLGLDEWWEGLYFRLNLPVTHARWELFDNDCCASACGSNNCNSGCGTTNCNTGFCGLPTDPFPATYMASTTVDPFTCVADGLALKAFGDKHDQSCFGRIQFCRQTKTRLADVDLILGYDFWRTECGHLGIYLQAVAPTGNRPNPCSLFSPIIGNGHHWELGGGVSGHYTLWEDDCDQSLSIWLEGNVTHMFKDCQSRSFDLLGRGPLSRYMLLKEIDPVTLAYAGNLITAIDFTTRRVDISRDVKGDASFKFYYRYCNWGVDLGYNIYGHSKEEACGLSNTCCPNVTPGATYGIKGTEGVACENFVTGATLPTTVGAPVSISLLNSTVTSATVNGHLIGICDTTTSNQVDNRVTTFNNPTALQTCLTWDSLTTFGLAITDATGVVNASGVIVAQTSVPPVTLTDANLDLCSGLACAQITHKVFAHINYIWSDCDYTPFLGLGGNVEFSQNDSCKVGLNQWGILLKGGFVY